MPKLQLSERNVKSLPLPKGTVKNKDSKRKGQPVRDIRYWDKGDGAVKGLHVLVTREGTRTYRVLYRFPSSHQDHTLSLGAVGDINLEDARDKAREVRKGASKGVDPKPAPASVVDDAADDDSGGSFKACVRLWTRREQIGRKGRVSAERSKQFLLGHTKRWHDRPIASFGYVEIEDMLADIRDGTKRRKPAKSSANLLFALLRTMFRWAARSKRYGIAVSPMLDMPKPWEGAKPRERPWFEGKKSDATIKAVWQAADQLGGSQGKFLKLLLITGKRVKAVETMRWDHIDDDWYWRPTCGNKFKLCHPITLPKLAQRILKPRGDKGRVLDPIRPEQIMVEVRRLTGINDFILHGCKHIVITKLKELKVKPHVAREMTDHKAFSDVHADYEHIDYRDEVRDALELWASHIEKVIAPAAGVAVLK